MDGSSTGNDRPRLRGTESLAGAGTVSACGSGTVTATPSVERVSVLSCFRSGSVASLAGVDADGLKARKRAGTSPEGPPGLPACGVLSEVALAGSFSATDAATLTCGTTKLTSGVLPAGSGEVAAIGTAGRLDRNSWKCATTNFLL